MFGKPKTRWTVSILFTLALHIGAWIYSGDVLPPAMATATARQQLSVTFVQSSAAAEDRTSSEAKAVSPTPSKAVEVQVAPTPATKETDNKTTSLLPDTTPSLEADPPIDSIVVSHTELIPQPPAKKPTPPTRTVENNTAAKPSETPVQKTDTATATETEKQPQKEAQLASLEATPEPVKNETTGSNQGTADTSAISSSSVTSPTYEDLPLLTEPSFSQPPSPPEYPKRAQRKRIEGEVVLRARVDEQGLVRRIIVWQSSGHNLLDKAAEKAMWGWQFTPARQGNLRTAAWVEFPIRFAIH
ncbi:TonB family protein [Kiloniella laminariae]|uniref:TonB family protein n=1 Tax=Kiloniella laminariae TaxID=454162 RepID=A0ABT4LQI2_9PROT|nr:energy transducer TonB [Kiloniella laminariae]MCZ4282192.1 TonB family protein [Kiloniella laminariae]